MRRSTCYDSGMIKHVWFDMAGTLYHETPEFEAEHNRVRYTTYAEVTGITDMAQAEREYEALQKQYGSNSAVFTSLGKPSDFWQIAFDNVDLSTLLKPDPEITATLEALAGKLPISLFTNLKRTKIEPVLRLLDIDPALFTHSISGDDLVHRKPHPEGYCKVVELSGLPANQLLYVGDKVDKDVLPAKAEGIQTCLLWQNSPEATYSALRFKDLLEIIG